MPVFTLNVSLSSGCITKRTSFRLVLGLLSMYWAIARHAFLDATFLGNLWNPVVRPGKAIEETFWLSSSFRHLEMKSICICNWNGYFIYIYISIKKLLLSHLIYLKFQQYQKQLPSQAIQLVVCFFCRGGASICVLKKTKTNLFCVIWSIFLETPVAGGFTSKFSRTSYCHITLGNPCGVLLVTFSL